MVFGSLDETAAFSIVAHHHLKEKISLLPEFFARDSKKGLFVIIVVDSKEQ